MMQLLTRPTAVAGTMLLFTGAALLVVVFLDRVGLDESLPAIWRGNRPLWQVISFVTFLCGCKLQWDSRVRRIEPAVPNVLFASIVLYTRDGCQLCDEAKELIIAHAEHFPELIVVDVDGDEQLVERFGQCVPVVEIDGRVRFRGQVNEVLLQRLIDAARRRQSNADSGNVR